MLSDIPPTVRWVAALSPFVWQASNGILHAEVENADYWYIQVLFDYPTTQYPSK